MKGRVSAICACALGGDHKPDAKQSTRQEIPTANDQDSPVEWRAVPEVARAHLGSQCVKSIDNVYE